MNDSLNIAVPADLRILILGGTRVPKHQLDLVLKCHNLIKLDLSNNLLASVPNLSKLSRLRILYLHQNQLASAEGVFALQVHYLTLFLNPVSAQANLRKQVVAHIKTLWALDFNAVTDEERHRDLKVVREKSRIPWPVVSGSDLTSLWDELRVVRRAYERCSSVITLQRWVRGWIARLWLARAEEKRQHIHNLVRAAVDQWRRFTRNRRDLNAMMARQYEEQFGKVKNLVQRYRQRKGRLLKELRSGRVIMRVMKQYQQSTLGMLKSIETGASGYKLYFSKDQLPVFRQLLSQIALRYQNLKLDTSLVDSIVTQANIKYDDFQKQHVLYQSEVFTYRLPTQWQLAHNFQRSPLQFPCTLAKVSYCLMHVQLGIIRKWRMFSKFQSASHSYPYVQRYEEEMPQRKFRIYRISAEDKNRFRKTMQLINKFQMREYRQLYVITVNREICKDIIKQMVYYNHGDPDQYFVLYPEKFIRRAAAALKIQRKFRAYLDVKRHGMTITQIIATLKKERCIRILQRWCQNVRYNHRNNFFKSIAHRIRHINKETLFLPLNLYIGLQDISLTIKFKEQSGQLVTTATGCSLVEEERSLIPQWVIPNDQEVTGTPCDIYHLMHYQARVRMVNFDSETWVSFQFQSLQEAKMRIILLALSTYRFANSVYVSMWQEHELNHAGPRCEQWARVYCVESQLRSYDAVVPSGKQIFLSEKPIAGVQNHQIKLSFYQHGMKGSRKQISAMHLQKLPKCMNNTAECYFAQEPPSMVPTQENRQTQMVTTASTNYRTLKLPEQREQQFIKHQESFEKEHLNKLIKQTTNPSRQCYRNKSTSTQNTNVQTMLPFGQQVQKSASFHQSDDLERQKRQREASMQRVQQDRVAQVRKLKEAQRRAREEKGFETELITGQNMIARQEEKHKFKLQVKTNASALRQLVSKRQQEATYTQEIPRVLGRLAQDVSYQSCFVYPEESRVTRSRWAQERGREVRVNHKYIHTVLPGEVYPMRMGSFNE